MAVATLAWEGRDGTGRELPARIEDTSRSGACIRIAEPLEVGTKVTLDWRMGRFPGEVRYCRFDQDQYSAGLQLDPNARASQAGASKKTNSAATKEPAASPADSCVQATAADPAGDPLTETNPAPASESFAEARGASTEISAEIDPEADDGTRGSDGAETTSGPGSWQTMEEAATAWNVSEFGQVRTFQPPRRTERLRMIGKWLNLGSKQDAQNGSDGGFKAHPAQAGAARSKPSGKATDASFGDFLSLEDVYRATGILDSRTGYNIQKVVEMLSSSHIRGLPDEMRRASVLMALDTAGISVNEILKDAKLRLDALAKYEADQQRRVQEFESEKMRENAAIQQELERITEHYLSRMQHNLDEVARVKDPFAAWQAMKQKESQRISEAVDVCSKHTGSGSTAAGTTGVATPELRPVIVPTQPADRASTAAAGTQAAVKA